MPFGLDDWALGKGLDLGLKYGVKKVREIWAQDSIDRLLLLLHSQFEEQTGATLEDFQAFKTDQRVREPLEAFLAGQSLDAASLGRELAKFFPNQADPGRLGLAMAETARDLAPFARDGSEAEAAISAQLADNFAQVRGLLAQTAADVAAMRTETREQLAGLEALIKVRLPGQDGPEPETPPSGGAPALPPERPRGGGGGAAVRPDPDAQEDAAQLLVERMKGSDAPELTVAFQLAQAGRHEEAAARFAEQAERFETQQLSELAEECRQNQASALEAAGHDEEARDVRVLVVRHQIDRGTDLALVGARKLLNQAPADERWRFEALLAEADWPEQPAAAVEAFAYGASHADGDEALHWAAVGVEVLSILRDYSRALDLAGPWRATEVRLGDRLRLELDVLEALQEIEGAAAAEPGWEALLTWTRHTPAATQAMVIARRGHCLLRREQLEPAVACYGRALELWAQVPGFEDQVGEAYWSIQAAGGLMGLYRPPHAELRGTAAGLRGGVQSPAARAETLEARAMEARLNDKLFDALRGFWLALALHRRNGNLRGWLYDSVMLGEVLLDAGRGSLALACFVQAGREDRAAKAAEAAVPQEASAALSAEGPRWERAATYAALATVGRRLPADAIQMVARRALAEAKQPMGSLIGPQPANRAREAVAGLLLALPVSQRHQALPILRATAETQHPVLARRAAQALLLATNAGISDETGFLVERYLDEPGVVGVSSPWIAARLAGDEEARRRVEEAAAAGNSPALEALAISETPSDNPAIRERVSERIQEWLIENAAADPTHSVGMGGYEDLGIIGRLADARLRDQLARALTDLAQDARYPEATRASAANAVFNLASVISEALRPLLVRQMLPLAAGEYERSQWDDPSLASDDPLARFKVSFGSAGDLQAGALGAASAMAAAHRRPHPRLRKLLYQTRLDQRNNVAAAAYEALARVPELAPVAAIEVGLAHSDARVRAAALRAWMAKAGRAPLPVLSARLLLDPDLNVRLTFLNLASELAVRDIVVAFRDDPDAYVRVTAETLLAQMQ